MSGVAVGVAQRRVPDEPCRGAQHSDEPPADTTCIPSSQHHRHEVEHCQREVAGDIVEPGDHRHEDDGHHRDGSLRDASEELEPAMNRGESLFPSRGAEGNRADEQVRLTELLCFHLDLFELSSLSI